MKKPTFHKNLTIEKVKREKDPLGEALTSFFGKNCYWIHRKYNRARVERAFDIAQKTDDHTFENFMNNVLHG